MNRFVGNNLINATCQYRVETTKALFLAYEEDVRNTLERNLSSEFRTLMIQHQNPSMTHSQAESEAFSNTVKTGINKALFILVTGGLPLLAPNYIYDINTSFDTSAYTHMIIGADLFFQILTAYMDEAFICDKLPTAANVRLFTVAFADAYTCAVQYVGNHATESNERTTFKNLLLGFLSSDPTILAFLKAVIANEINNNFTPNYFNAFTRSKFRATNLKAPGLSQFTNSQVFGIYSASKNYDELSDDYELFTIINEIEHVLTGIRESYQQRIMTNNRLKTTLNSNQLHSKNHLKHVNSRLNPFEMDITDYRESAEGFRNPIETGFGFALREELTQCNESAIKLMENGSLMQELTEHLYNVNKLMNTMAALLGNSVLAGELHVQDPQQLGTRSSIVSSAPDTKFPAIADRDISNRRSPPPPPNLNFYRSRRHHKKVSNRHQDAALQPLQPNSAAARIYVNHYHQQQPLQPVINRRK